MSVNACMNLFGLLHEVLNEGREPRNVDWSPFWFGCFAGAVPWAIVFSYLAGSSSASGIPGFVWALLVVYAVFFNSEKAPGEESSRQRVRTLANRCLPHRPLPASLAFPLNMYLQYAQWHWWSDDFHGWPGAGYLFGERMYQLQSLVSKSFLLWLVVGGSNQPSSFTGTRAQ